MARTKHSAKRSTGAPAARRPLPDLSMPAKAAPSEAFRRSHRQRQLKADSTSPTPGSQLLSTDLPTICVVDRAKTPNYQLAVDMNRAAGSFSNMDTDHDDFCCACRNGGTMYPCMNCLRVVCKRCIDHSAVLLQEGIYCPYCHLRENVGDVTKAGPNGKAKRGGSKVKPYKTSYGNTLRYIGLASTRESFPRCVSEPVVVISIILEGMESSGPARVLYETMAPYFRDGACYVYLKYNLETKKEMRKYCDHANKLVDMVENGCLKGYRRFAVFLTTHSDPERGDLHFAPEGPGYGASPVSNVLNYLFGDRFGAMLKQGKDATLTLLTCGSVVELPQPLQDLKAFHENGIFNEILAFTQANLQGCFTDRFIVNHYVNYFIHLQPSIEGFLYDHQALGAHTNLVLLTHQSREGIPPTVTATRYLWAHDTIRPLGNTAPFQCTSCFSLKPWQADQDGDTIVHTCKGVSCGKKIKYELLSGATRIVLGNRGKKNIRDDRGVWWKQEL